jgi:hypothetical protein
LIKGLKDFFPFGGDLSSKSLNPVNPDSDNNPFDHIHLIIELNANNP